MFTFKRLVCTVIAAAILCSAALAMGPAGSPGYRLVDISHYDRITDWPALSAAVDGIYIKATEGVTYTDVAYEGNTRQAKLQGIPVGYYHFFWPWGDDSGPFKARQQADHFYSTTRTNSQQLLPVVDVEEANGCVPAEIAAGVAAFCDELVRVDGAPGVMIYCSPSFASSYLSGLTTYPLWVAHYGVSSPAQAGAWPAWTAWQYTSSGSLPGVSGQVDLNRATAGVYLITPPRGGQAPAQPAAAQARTLIASDIFSVAKLPYPVNATALCDLDVRDRNGMVDYSRMVSVGDRVTVTGIINGLYDVTYPTSKGYVHGYVTGRPGLFCWLSLWQNGSTPETVYNASEQRIGTIFPHESARQLYASPYTGQPFLLYDTSAGAGTKVGFVNYQGVQ